MGSPNPETSSLATVPLGTGANSQLLASASSADAPQPSEIVPSFSDPVPTHVESFGTASGDSETRGSLEDPSLQPQEKRACPGLATIGPSGITS
eukprot:829383-Rhodomonas_salina.1